MHFKTQLFLPVAAVVMLLSSSKTLKKRLQEVRCQVDLVTDKYNNLCGF